MANIIVHVGINVAPPLLYKALVTKQGLSSWLVTRIDSETYSEGDTVKFYFPEEYYAVLYIQKIVPNILIEWKCIEQNFSKRNGWNNTFMRFELVASQDNNTLLTFTHIGWKEENSFYKYSLKRWTHFIGTSLHRFLENGIIETDTNSFQRSPKNKVVK